MIPYEEAHKLYMKDLIQRITLNRATTLRKRMVPYGKLTYEEWRTSIGERLIIMIPWNNQSILTSPIIESEDQYVKRLSTIL